MGGSHSHSHSHSQHSVDTPPTSRPLTADPTANYASYYELLGYRVKLDVPDPIAHQAVTSIFSGFGPYPAASGERVVRYSLTRDAAGGWSVRVRNAIVQTDLDLATALLTLEWHLFTDALTRCRDRFHLHGAALAPPDGGDGILLIGDSGSGKTTLTLGLLLRGFVPCNDDVTLLDPVALTAQPFPRAFHLEAGTRDLLAARDLPDDWDLDAMPPGYFMPPRWALRPVAIRFVLFPSYQPGAAPTLTRLAVADAATALLQHTTSLVRTPQIALPAVSRLTARAQCYHFVAGDLDAALDAIVALMAFQAPPIERPDPESVG